MKIGKLVRGAKCGVLCAVVMLCAGTAMAMERVVLQDVHQEGSGRDTLSYTYQTLELSPAISYKLVTTVKVATGNPGERTVKFASFTNDVSEINAIVTKTVGISSLFGDVVHPDGDIYLSLIGADATPVGTVFDFMGSTIPQGYLLCDGRAVSRTTYARLFAVLGTKCGSGDGSTTFNLPNFSNRISQGAGSHTLGTSIAAGVPNIKGSTSQSNQATGPVLVTLSGAFNGSVTGGTTGWTNGSADRTCITTWNFDAAKGEYHGSIYRNDVYGKSDTVQPAAIAVSKVIKY